MPNVGKSLVFYFKYWNEMTRLYKSAEAELEGLPEPEKTREMAREVGGKAHSQAADLLEACAPGLEDHFKSIGKCDRITARKIVEKKWSLYYAVRPKGKLKPAKPKIQVGMDIVRQEKPEIIPWLWRFGGEEAEKKLEFIFASRAKVRSQDVDRWPLGCIGLDRIPILPDSLDGFDVDCQGLIEQVRQSFKLVTPDDLEFLWK